MNQNDEHLTRLLDAYFEGLLDDSSKEELERWLVASDRARSEFWKRSAFEHALETAAEKRRGLALLEPAPRLPRRWVRPLVMVSGWVTAAAAVVVLLLSRTPSPVPELKPSVAESTGADFPLSIPVARQPISGPTVAYLARMADVEGQETLRAGQSLEAGREIAIDKGWLELDFFSGARLVVRGPARFRPESDMRVVMSEGRASMEVPESAKGFILELPDGKVTDFGTRFDVVVADGRTKRLQVNEGEIEVAGLSGGASARRVLEGQAVAMADDGLARTVDFRPPAAADLLAGSVSQDGAEENLRRWENKSARWSSDPAMLVHFRFLPDESGGRELLNRAVGGKASSRGTVVAAEWTRGRWPGKHALSFHNQADRVRVEIPGRFPEATFAAWVKADALPRRYNGLFLSESDIQGEVHWQLSEKGEFYFGVRPLENRPDWSFHRAFSGPVLGTADFGTWRMLATTYDAERKQVVHYVDGVPVATLRIEEPVALAFGRATLGNFFDPKAKEHAGKAGLGEKWSFRNWNGSIDEFMLFSRALAPEELRDLHADGQP